MNRGNRSWLEWLLVAAVILWVMGLPPAAALAARWLIRAPQEGFALLVGVIQLVGVLVFLALVRLAPSWTRGALACRLLVLSSSWWLLDGLSRQLLSQHPNWSALVRLLGGSLLVIGLGRWSLRRGPATGWPGFWRDTGLSRSGSLTWALAAGALVVWPWFLAGSLGDWSTSAGVVLQAAAEALVTEWIWRGLALHLLVRVTGRRWSAALVGLLLYTGFEISRYAAGSSSAGGWEAATAILVAVVATGLWALPGRGQYGVWGPVVFHFGYKAFPALFTDPRAEVELVTWAAQGATAVLTGFVGLMVLAWLIWHRFAPPRAGRLEPAQGFPRPHGAVAAGSLWALSLILYLTAGIPGFHNDGYLIILREQVPVGVESARSHAAALYQALVDTAQRTQEPIRTELERLGLSYRPYYLVNMIRVDGTTRGMTQFARWPEVAQVLHHPAVRPYPIRWRLPYGPAGPVDATPAWGVTAVHAPEVWKMGITGAGIVVAGQDSGIDWEHPELQDSYRGWDGQNADHDRNWHDAWDDGRIPVDDDQHGTHTLGTVVGNRVGMAPDAQWIGCRNMRRGIGNPGSYVECMEFFFAPYPLGGDPFEDGDPSLAPHVVNNSWGCPPEEGCTGPEPLRTAVEVMRAAGILMVVSAGNEGPACETIWLPASEDAVLTVGATNQQDQITGYSSRGPSGELIKPDVVAPGVGIVSSIPGGGYGRSEGTSMAGPHVAGLAALLWSAAPDLVGDITRTHDLIVQTAEERPVDLTCQTDVQECACGQTEPGMIPNNVYGYGIVDALAAVQAALSTSNATNDLAP